MAIRPDQPLHPDANDSTRPSVHPADDCGTGGNAALDATADIPPAGGEDGTAEVPPGCAEEVPQATTPTQAKPMEPGTRVGRYLIIECIGAGAMGQVYAAYDPELDRKVAVKILHAKDVGGSDESDPSPSSPGKRLLREAKALSQLAHPNVVGVFDVGTLDDQVFVAMEFVAGTDLYKWSRQEPRAYQQVLDVYLQAGQGLAAAHAAGLVHRDFKPHNAILGGDGRVRVLDFGLATARSNRLDPQAITAATQTLMEEVDTQDGWERLTMTGTVMGTPAFMAPEVMLGEPADEKSDQFSFCVSLYQALYGCRPFEGRALHELREAIQAGRITEHPTVTCRAG